MATEPPTRVASGEKKGAIKVRGLTVLTHVFKFQTKINKTNISSPYVTCQRATALYVDQDIGRLYERRIIKANKMLQVVEKNRSDEIISLSKMRKSFVFLFC